MTGPRGILVIKTIAMPTDTNASGDIFGGWLLSQMDLGGAVLAYYHANNRVATVAIDGMVFLKPVKVGDLVSCYAELTRQGRTSMTIYIEAWAESRATGVGQRVTHGNFTFVALNPDGKPTPIIWNKAQ
ncbi:MAG: acyl-CoA thioesterase [Pseudomonadota bacterium]